FWIAYCFVQRGDTQNGLTILEEVERECETRGYKWLQSLTQIGLANGFNRKTEYSQAVDYTWASYNISQQLADKNGELRSLSLLANLYRDMGNYRRSLYTAQQGLNLGSEISADASQMIGFYATSAWSLNSLGHHPAALEYEKQALNLGEVMNNPLVRSRYRVQMGLIQGMLKNYDEAIRNIRLGIEVGQSVGGEESSKEMSTYGQLYLGQAYREAGRYAEALAALAEVESFCQQRNDEQLWLLHDVKKEQLLTRIAQGDFASADDELTRVLNDYEDQRQKIHEESNRKTFFDKEQSIYDVAIDFALSHSSDAQKAFDYSESSRARSLLDISGEHWDVTDEQRIPDLRFLNAVKPMLLNEIRQNLPDRAQLLQFAVLKDKLIIWYVTRERLENAVVSVSSDELMEKVDRLLTLVTTIPSDDDKQLQKISGEFFDLLIKPLFQFLDPQKELCIIPDKALNLLPFNVLFSPLSKRYLIEDFALSYASSANVFVRQSRLANEKGTASEEEFFGVGNPSFDKKAFPELVDLPSATREVESISRFYDRSMLLLDGEATKLSVLNEMRIADVLHFATHYLPDATSPMFSKLVLARDGSGQGRAQEANEVLHAYEIYRLKPLRSRLAILAGCQTGVEEYVNGEGPIGLVRPFHAAGVPLVIASLWPVDSQATTELMIEFHRLRRQDHHSSAEALREAQLHMLRQENSSHRNAYYWASFSLIGGYSDY
ncbi:MAG TPA: CHAT domain-containing protein, partial [Pyrinomonadaceae bacterium]